MCANWKYRDPRRPERPGIRISSVGQDCQAVVLLSWFLTLASLVSGLLGKLFLGWLHRVANLPVRTQTTLWLNFTLVQYLGPS